MTKKIDKAMLDKVVKGNKYDIPLYWANMLTSQPIEKIGVEKAGGRLLIGKELEKLVKGNKFLKEKLGIILPLVIGGCVQYNSLPDYRYERTINGLRQTPKESLDSLLTAAGTNLQNVAGAFQKEGINVRTFLDDVFVVVPHGYEIDHETGEKVDMGRVGDIVHVKTDKIIESIYDGCHPILSHMGKDTDGNLYNINSINAAASLVNYLDAQKLLVLIKGYVKDENYNRIPELTEIEARRMIREGIIDKGMALNIEEPLNMLTGRTIQLIQTGEIPKELLTDDGIGTMIRMPFVIKSYSSFDHVDDMDMLKQLINKTYISVEKKVVDDYFSNIKPKMIYLDKDKTGGAIIRDLDGHPYACKIFKHPDFRGNGLASQIIEQAVNDFGSLTGRADINNWETCKFYRNLIDGWDNTGKTPKGKITKAKEIGRYLIFGINVESDKWESIKQKVAQEPATVVHI